jgi:phage N-6-adenine-methyltransferase
MSKIPVQKPGRSYQDYQTPKEFLEAVKKRLHIAEFIMDLAASPENAIAETYYTEEDDALIQPWALWGSEWCFCNPPYADIEPWVAKAVNEAEKGAHVAMLVPASVGSNWWKMWVEPYAYQSFLNGRLCFIPNWKEQGFKQPPLYPKDCALLLYTSWGFLGHECWSWK